MAAPAMAPLQQESQMAVAAAPGRPGVGERKNATAKTCVSSWGKGDEEVAQSLKSLALTEDPVQRPNSAGCFTNDRNSRDIIDMAVSASIPKNHEKERWTLKKRFQSECHLRRQKLSIEAIFKVLA